MFFELGMALVFLATSGFGLSVTCHYWQKDSSLQGILVGTFCTAVMLTGLAITITLPDLAAMIVLIDPAITVITSTLVVILSGMAYYRYHIPPSKH